MTTTERLGRKRWLMLAVLFLARMAMAVQFQSVAAIGPLVIEAYDIDYAQLGTLIGIFMLPGIVLGLPGGLLGQRFGDKRIAVLGLGLMVAGGLGGALSATYGLALLARAACGAGAVLMTIVLTKMLMDWFSGREVALAMALFLNSWPVGLGLTLLSLPSLTALGSVAVALMATAAVGVVALIVLWLVYQPPPGLARPQATLRFQMSRAEWLLVAISGAVWGLYNVGFIVPVAFGASFVSASGTPLSTAGAVVSLATWVCIFSAPLGGYLAGRTAWPNALMIGSLLGLALTSAALAAGMSPPIAYALLGVLAGLPAGQLMVLPSEALRQENRAVGIGVFFSCYYALVAGLVPIAGLVRDLSGSPAAPLVFGAIVTFMAAALVGVFRAVHRSAGRAAEASFGQLTARA